MKYSRQIWAVGLLAACVAGGAAYWLHARQGALPEGLVRANGRLEVERVEIAAKYPGRIVALPIQEGDLVEAGQLIAQQDTAELMAQKAAIEAARQRASEARQRALAETEVRKVQARLAQMELDHTTRLRKDALVSAAEVERRQAQRDGEQAGVAVATAAIGEAEAARAEAEAQIRRVNVAIGDMSLRAPIRGRVEYRVVEPGSILPSGGRVATLLDLSNVYMTVFLPTSVSGRLKVGDDARIVLDAASDFTFPAQVSFVAAEAQFTPKYVETTDERDKLVYRVKLRVPADVALAYADYVKAGLTGYGYVRSTPEARWPASLVVKLPPAPAAAPAPVSVPASGASQP